ncbi:hypothetical protein WH95_10705 [Kiloniella litopenaei]|uniref:YdhG-like domain-containing protein n=1 Tax=Kiloniella litopenaei TaxID=1549748 RepID=A0A0M2RB89_9PROT|nr:DUF1801 domain-containing protein [Kiloniella litopenaei]KKJ76888.1 hypothetical protein WH95_10705 [Kiloniella litopenaei]
MTSKSLPVNVATAYENYPANLRNKLLDLRKIILDTAASIPDVGPIEETLKWGQPSFLTTKSKSGTTIRIDKTGDDQGQYALYVHCQTTLLDQFRELYPTEFTYSGNRAILFNEQDIIAKQALQHCISLALTYHLNKK